jgi:hypothetical protein
MTASVNKRALPRKIICVVVAAGDRDMDRGDMENLVLTDWGKNMGDCKHPPPLMWFMQFKVDWNLVHVGRGGTWKRGLGR